MKQPSDNIYFPELSQDMLIPIRNHLVIELLAWGYDCVDGREPWGEHMDYREEKRGSV